MGLIAIDKVWPLGFCFGVQGFWPSDFLAFFFNTNTQNIYINQVVHVYLKQKLFTILVEIFWLF